MGIRFLCPSGHKLNVKSFLAGKRGICPHCGAKFEIPFESVASAPPPPAMAGPASKELELKPTGPGSKLGGRKADQRMGPLAPVSPVVPAAKMGSVGGGNATSTPTPQHEVDESPAPAAADRPAVEAGPATTASPGPIAASAVASWPTTETAKSSTEASNASAAPEPLRKVPPVSPATPAVTPDPIAEAPSAIWYVRTNTGGQFGPARGDVMRQWIDERRVGPDYLVWREGWPEWRRASAVFPKLAALGTATTASPTTASPTNAAPVQKSAAQKSAAPQMEDDWVEAIIESQTHALHHKPRPKRTKNNNLLMIISFLVVLLGLILVVVVIIAAKKQGQGSNSDNPSSTTTTASFPPLDRADHNLVATLICIA